MTEYTMTSFMVALILGSLIIGLYILSVSGMNEIYDLERYGWDNSTIQKFDRLDEMKLKAEQAKINITNLNQEPGVTDILGLWFSNGYTSLKMIGKSFDIFYDITSGQISETLGLGEAGKLLQTAIISIVMIIIFVGIILAAIIKVKL